MISNKCLKYVIGKNVCIKQATINDIRDIELFQSMIINNMDNKEFFTPLTTNEFVYPITNNGRVYLLYYQEELIGLCVLTINVSLDVISKYCLNNNNNNIGILDSVMIKDGYRGSGLQVQVMKILYEEAKRLGIMQIVATVHPNNIYSLNNLIKEGYEIINKINIHGGYRYIVVKDVRR